jgi:NAD(P)-dependent dehydrogenase (short-subunit alcohol dehydrogenase family)
VKDLTAIKGHVAVISGGTLGIGFAVAEKLVSEGARVAIIGRNAENGAAALAKLEAQGGEAMFLQADCTVGAQVNGAIAAVIEKWQKIDIAVTCTGGFLKAPRITEIDEETWRSGIDWNLTAAFLVVRAVVPSMKEKAYGRVVNVSSVGARTGMAAAPIEYAGAKAGVEGFTRRLAAEVAPFGITANVVAPGTTLSPRVARLSERRLEAVRQTIPVGRLAEPAEIALAIWYFCTPGSGFATGAVLDINGGVWTGG